MKKLVFLFALLLVGVAAAAPSVVSTTQTSATVEGLDCGSKYRFEIRKYAANGELSADEELPRHPAALRAAGPGDERGDTDIDLRLLERLDR